MAEELAQSDWGALIPLRPRAPTRPVPLAGSQRRLWNLLAPGQRLSSRSVTTAERVLGDIDAELLATSVTAVVERHASLRTTIAEGNGEPRQIISTRSLCGLDRLDLCAIPTDQRAAAARRAAANLSEERVDLTAGPLLKVLLLQLTPTDHVLVLAADHMIADAASLEIVKGEIWTLYEQGVRHVQLSLPQVKIQFADYAVWQDETYQSWRARHESYWRERLTGAPSTRIPCGNRSSESGLTDTIKHIPFGKHLTLALRDLAMRHGASLPQTVLAIYAHAMAGWCAQRDLVVQFVTHGRRQHAELEAMVGFLATCLHLRIRIESADTFVDLLQRVREELHAAFVHYDYDRVGQLVPDLRTDVGFNWIHAQAARAPASDGKTELPIRLQPFRLEMAWCGKFFAFFQDTAAGVNVTIAYRSDTLTERAVDRFALRMRALAQAVTRSPSAPLDSLAAALD